MKKFLKSIFITLCLSLVIICASAFLHINKSNTCYAANEDNMHTVNFYNGDSLLYSIEVPDGQSLQDLVDSNLLYNLMPNTSFDLATTNDYYSFPLYAPNGSHFVFRGVQNVEYIDEISYFDTSSSGISFIRLYDSNSNIIDLTNKRVFFSLYVDDYLNVFDIQLNSYSVSGNVWTSKVSTSSGVIQNSRARIYYNSSTGVWECGLDLWDNVKHKISAIKLQYDEYTPFLNLNYIDTLFKEKNNLSKDTNVLWSIIKNTGQFNFSQPITKDTNIYGYEELEFNQNAEQLEAEASYQPSYYLLEKAIDNIEYIHYKGNLFYNIDIDTSKLESDSCFMNYKSNILFDFISLSNETIPSATNYLDSFAFSTYGFNDLSLNLIITSNDKSIKLISYGHTGSYEYDFYLLKNTGIVTFSFVFTEFVIDDNNVVYDVYEDYIFYDGKDINDMNSNTNYFLNFNAFDEFINTGFLQYYSDFSKVSQYIETEIMINFASLDFNNTDKYLLLYFSENNNYKSYKQYMNNIILGSLFYLEFGESDRTENEPTFNYGYIPLSSYKINSGFKFSQFDIIVRKPVARVDNSLVIFNYGYNNFLNAVTQVKYELRRGINYYDVVYNGKLENSKMIVIDNEHVRNSLFDEYIFVSFIIDGDGTTTFDIKDGKIGTYLGFDFNFVYYTQPLVAGNASYDLMQYRPEYMDGTPSLFPLNIPFTAWIYNAFLWLIFDCPLISDLLGLLYLNSFMGALLNILNIYMTSGIGEFVMACLTFIIFWAILKSLMPALVGTGKSIYNNSQYAYNKKRFKAEAKELKYQEYKKSKIKKE